MTDKGALLLLALSLAMACNRPAPPAADKDTGWKQQLAETLPLLGHRNWIIIADKAFPQQNAAGMTYINTNAPLLPVLQHVIKAVRASGHVQPVFYRDRELAFVEGAEAARFHEASERLLGGAQIQTLLHDSVFVRLSEASEQFNVLVLKTNERIPYSSVLLQLDCAYWSAEKEAALRERMTARQPGGIPVQQQAK